WARRYFYPGCHRMEPYAALFPHLRDGLPVTDAVTARVLSLPTGTAVGEAEIRTIGTILRLALEHADKLRGVLASTPSPLVEQTPAGSPLGVSEIPRRPHIRSAASVAGTAL